AVPTVCLRRTGLSVQSSSLLPLPVAEAALAPLRELGIRILNYLDDWLILAHLDVVLNHLAQLGLQVNCEKSKLSPVQRISFLGVELDSVSMSAHLSPERAQSVLSCATTFRCGSTAPGAHGILSRGHATGFDAHETVATLASYPSPRWSWRRGTFRVNITPSCRKTLSPWTDIVFLWSGVPLEQV
ncbi:hypothetical protein M9458_018887, partial [Cirrhinus mrigala]